MDSFYNDSLNVALLRSFSWAKLSDVATRAASLYIAGAIFGSPLAFNYFIVIGVSAVRFDYINVLQQPLDAVLFHLVDGSIEILIHYAVVFFLHHSSRLAISTTAELMEMCLANPKTILTICVGIVMFIVSAERPWDKLVVAYQSFKRIDRKISGWKNGAVGFIIARLWFLLKISIFITAVLTYLAVFLLLILEKMIDDAWVRYLDAVFNKKLRPVIPAALLTCHDFDSAVRIYKGQVVLEAEKWILFQVWRVMCWPLGPVKDPFRLAAGYPHTVELSDRPDYQYHELLVPKGIRLLKLDKSSGVTVQCSLVPFSLHNIPHYECISYTWGNATPTHEIFIDGYSFQTSKTVWLILRAQSSPWRTRYIWIDSICINQKDNQERSSQVAMMREIYHKASKVIVWLGDFVEAPQATQLLAELRAAITESGCTAEGVYKRYLHKSRSASWSSLIKLLKLPWFHRVWVVQEIAFARKLHVLVGGRTFDWENFLAVIQMFTDPALSLLLQEDADFFDLHSAIDGMRHVLQMAHFRRITQRRLSLTLACYLESTSGFMSTDPRDRVFALLGLVDESLRLEPDYSRSVEQVYFNTANLLISNSGNPLFILSFAGTGYDRNKVCLPSWVPDWSATRNGRFTLGHAGDGQGRCYRAGGLAWPIVRVNLTQTSIRDCTLHLSGIFVDTIERVGNLLGGLTTQWAANINPWLDYHSRQLQIYQQAKEFSQVHRQDLYPSGCARREALWRTLIGDTVGDMRPAPIEYGSFCEEWEEMTNNIFSIWADNGLTLAGFQKDSYNSDPELRQYFPTNSIEDTTRCHHYASWTTAAARCLYERRFCVTEKGYFGLLPPGSRIGDRVCVVLGGQTPFLLRQHPLNPTWELIGECYIHGMMDGEMLKRGYAVEDMTIL